MSGYGPIVDLLDEAKALRARVAELEGEARGRTLVAEEIVATFLDQIVALHAEAGRDIDADGTAEALIEDALVRADKRKALADTSGEGA